MNPPDDEQHRPFPDPEHSIAPRKPRTVGGMVYLIVLAATLLGIALVVLDQWRLGLTVVSGALGVAAVVRLLLPEEAAGMLKVRRRLVDVAVLASLGIGLAILSAVIRGRPG